LFVVGRGWAVAALSIRDLDDSVKEKLRLRAAQHGRSMEAEIRAILTSAVIDEAPGVDLFHALTDRFARLGGADLDLPPRVTPPRAADLPE
jgi:plasmid stability protein